MLGDNMDIDTRYINELEVVINLFTIENGIIKILLVKKDTIHHHYLIQKNILN